MVEVLKLTIFYQKRVRKIGASTLDHRPSFLMVHLKIGTIAVIATRGGFHFPRGMLLNLNIIPLFVAIKIQDSISFSLNDNNYNTKIK